MKLYISTERLDRAPFYNDIYDVELTPKEMREIYEEQQRIYAAKDIGQNITDKIEDAGKEDDYAEDWPFRVGEAMASQMVKEIEDNEHIMGAYASAVNDAVERKLKELGIDPDTMKRKKTQNSET